MSAVRRRPRHRGHLGRAPGPGGRARSGNGKVRERGPLGGLRGGAEPASPPAAGRGARASGLQGGAGRARGAALHPEMSGEPLKALLCGSDTAGFPPTSLLGSWPWRLGEVDGAREKGGGKGRLAAAARACAAALGLGGRRGRGPRTKCVSSPFLVCLSSPFFQQTLRVPFAGGSGEAGRGGRDQGSGVCHPLLSAAPPPSLHHLLPGSPQWFPSGHPAPPLVSREPPSARQPKWSSKHEEHPTPLRCRASSGAFSELGKKHELLTRPSRRAHCRPLSLPHSLFPSWPLAFDWFLEPRSSADLGVLPVTALHLLPFPRPGASRSRGSSAAATSGKSTFVSGRCLRPFSVTEPRLFPSRLILITVDDGRSLFV